MRLLNESVFAESKIMELDKYFQQNNYENKVNYFVEKLLNQISTIENPETDKAERFIFEDDVDFIERHLLWSCFDLLIKAELMISNLKRSRAILLNELLQQKDQK